MARKLGAEGLKYISEVRDLLDLYEPSHEYFYKQLSRVARKFNKDVPYSYGSFQGYRTRIEGAIVRAERTGDLGETLTLAHKQLSTLTAPQRGVKGANPKTVKREIAIENMNEWKKTVFDSKLSPADNDFKDVLIAEGLWDDDKFWLRFFRSNYFHPIYQDYREKKLGIELFKRLSLGENSYWVERLMDFYATTVKGVKGFRYKGQIMSDEHKDEYGDDEEDE